MKFAMRNLMVVGALGLTMSASQVDAAPVILNTNQVVGGTTTQLNLSTSAVSGSGKVTLSNNGSNLVVDFNSDASNSDFFLQWIGAGDGVGFNTATYSYVQIDFASYSSGMVTGSWQIFWEDDDSTVGGDDNSLVGLGNVDPSGGAPQSIVIDLVNGSSSGAKGWGAGTLDRFRIDIFQALGNKGESLEISGVTFGSTLVPEPGSLALLGLGGLLIARRRR